MEDYNSDLEQPSTELQGKAAEIENNLFTIVSAEYGLRMIYTSENGKYTATMEISPEEFNELYESILRE